MSPLANEHQQKTSVVNRKFTFGLLGKLNGTMAARDNKAMMVMPLKLELFENVLFQNRTMRCFLI